jgi:hypothetical protein
MNTYSWLMKKREQVHYQERYFNEPDRPSFLDFINSQVEEDKLLNLIEEIKNDNDFILPFQSEYAPLAIPIKRGELTRGTFNQFGVENILRDDQITHLNRFAPYLFY